MRGSIFERAGREIKVIDAHCHVGKWGNQVVFGRRIEPFKGCERESLEEVEDCMNKYCIERSVLVPTYCPDPAEAFGTNLRLLEYARMAQGKIVPGFWVDPSPSQRHLLLKALRLATDEGIRVVKTSPDAWDEPYSPDPSTWDAAFVKGVECILDYARDRRTVFQIHTGSGRSSVQAIEKLVRFAGPGVTFHLVHMGNSITGHFYLIPRMKEWVSDGLDIVCDTSLCRGFALRWALREFMEDPQLATRILFASDEPWGAFEVELFQVLHAAEFRPMTLQKVLYENADSVYGLWRTA